MPIHTTGYNTGKTVVLAIETVYFYFENNDFSTKNRTVGTGSKRRGVCIGPVSCTVDCVQMLELLKDEDLDIRMAAVTGVCAILRQLITHLFTSRSFSSAGPTRNLTNSSAEYNVSYSFFWRARLCWPLLCLCRPFCIFERCPIPTQRAAAASRRGTNVATHLPVSYPRGKFFPYESLIYYDPYDP